MATARYTVSNFGRGQGAQVDALVGALTRVVKDHELFRLLGREKEVKDEEVSAQVVCSEALL